ncbi:hypothetical protein HOY80DRAFT_1022128 [Tuber brumale]|nr:hypothetical protein HOY80DRAFT_1022128 [Tuber brumale]
MSQNRSHHVLSTRQPIGSPIPVCSPVIDPRPTPPRALTDEDEEPRGRTLTRQSPASSKRRRKRNARSTNPFPIIIATDESDLSSDEDVKTNKRRRRGESRQACRYRVAAGKARLPPHNFPPRHVRRIAINKKVTRLTRQLEDADRRDRSSKDVSKWCTERSNVSTLVTSFIAKYYLDMKLIRARERLKFAQACVKCLLPYCGNRPTFDVADAMWRMLRALDLDLEMSKESGIDAVFKYWHDKKIYFRHVQKIAMEVEKRLTNMRCVRVADYKD